MQAARRVVSMGLYQVNDWLSKHIDSYVGEV